MTQRYCPDCESPLPQDSPEGLCPECLMKAALEISEDMTLSVGPISDIGEEVLPNPGDQFGEYRIERELGRGGMGAVYEAEQLETGRRVALKVLAHRLDSAEARARFFREGRLAASINHPNSVYVYGTGEVEGTPVIIMELVDGGTLYDRVKQKGPLPLGKAVDAIIDVISGLEAAQSKGILHRDIKPSNCFEDIGGSVKVGDFGLSISSEPSEESQLSSDGLFLGTPAFASPEQLRGEELNARSDIYSVGVTLFYLLTGRTPFEGHTSVQLVADVLDKAPPSPKNFRPEIPEKLAKLILRCLEKTPGDRFRNYDELHNSLMSFGTAAPTPAPLLRRFLAGIIDATIITLIPVVIGLWFSGGSLMKYVVIVNDYYNSPNGVIRMSVATLLFSLITVSYYTLLEWRWGCSLGKAVCRLRVADENKNAPVFKKALLRASICKITPYLPVYFFYYLAALGQVNVQNIALRSATGYSYLLVLAILFSTARKRNGLASIHDIVSNTRVVHKPDPEVRPVLPLSGNRQVYTSESMPRIGAYHVLETLSQGMNNRWLLAYDTRLLRKVWIHEVPAGTPELPGYQKTLRRVGRLRWITGRRHAGENWDVFEAPEGRAFADLAAEPQSWDYVRFWLLDLSEELTAAAKDNTVPEVLSLDRIWITSEGRAKLLDFPAPGLETSGGSDHIYRKSSFLSAVALTALEGSMDRSFELPLSAPVPLYVRRFLEEKKTMANPKAVGLELTILIKKQTHVTRQRRLVLLASCLVVPLLAFFFVNILFGIVVKNNARQPELAELSQLLMYRKKLADDRKLSIFINQRYRNIVNDPEIWNDYQARFIINGPDRDFVEKSIKDPPEATPEEITEAKTIIEERYLNEITKGMESAKEAADKTLMISLSAVLLTMFLFVALPAIIASFCFRGGLLLFILGMSVVREDGIRASRFRIFSRSLLTWVVPIIIIETVSMIIRYFASAIILSPMQEMIVFLTVIFCLSLFSTLLPERGIPDRIARTRLVLR